jgi:hypothetical protein
VRFDNVSDDRTAAGLAEHLFGYMNEFKCGNKLVAQTYDGCAVMAGQHNGLQNLSETNTLQLSSYIAMLTN